MFKFINKPNLAFEGEEDVMGNDLDSTQVVEASETDVNKEVLPGDENDAVAAGENQAETNDVENVKAEGDEEGSAEDFDPKRWKITLEGFRTREKEFLGTIKEQKSAIENFENRMKELERKDEVDKATEQGTLAELVEKKDVALREAESSNAKLKEEYEEQINLILKKNEEQESLLHTYVDSVISAWPEKFKKLIPSGEAINAQERMDKIAVAKPIVDEYLKAQKEAKASPGNGSEPNRGSQNGKPTGQKRVYNSVI